MNARIEGIVLEIQKSNKYRTISKETIEDIAATISPRYKKGCGFHPLDFPFMHTK